MRYHPSVCTPNLHSSDFIGKHEPSRSRPETASRPTGGKEDLAAMWRGGRGGEEGEKGALGRERDGVFLAVDDSSG